MSCRRPAGPAAPARSRASRARSLTTPQRPRPLPLPRPRRRAGQAGPPCGPAPDRAAAAHAPRVRPDNPRSAPARAATQADQPRPRPRPGRQRRRAPLLRASGIQGGRGVSCVAGGMRPSELTLAATRRTTLKWTPAQRGSSSSTTLPRPSARAPTARASRLEHAATACSRIHRIL